MGLRRNRNLGLFIQLFLFFAVFNVNALAAYPVNYYQCKNSDIELNYSLEWEVATDGALLEVPVLKVRSPNVALDLRGIPYDDRDIEHEWTGSGYIIKAKGHAVEFFAPLLALKRDNQILTFSSWIRIQNQQYDLQCRAGYHY